MYDATQTYERLKQFKITDEEASHSWLLKAERLTPDSEAYLVMCPVGEAGGKFYVLYCEDFIQSLEYVQSVVETWFESKLLKFIEPKQAANFEDSLGSQYYTSPDKDSIDKWTPYALPDRSGFTFLAEVQPTESNETYWATSRRTDKN